MKNPSVCPWQGLRTLPHAEHKQERHAESTLEPAQQAGFPTPLGGGSVCTESCYSLFTLGVLHLDSVTWSK